MFVLTSGRNDNCVISLPLVLDLVVLLVRLSGKLLFAHTLHSSSSSSSSSSSPSSIPTLQTTASSTPMIQHQTYCYDFASILLDMIFPALYSRPGGKRDELLLKK
jgi:hypothetical protein